MKVGDLIKYKDAYSDFLTAGKTYLVKRVEPKNDWVFVYGTEVPIQMSLMGVVSESR